MIKPVNISLLNTSNRLEYKCKRCLNIGAMNLTNSVVDVDSNGDPIKELDYECPNCNAKL